MMRTMIRITVERRDGRSVKTIHTEEHVPEEVNKAYLALLKQYPTDRVKQQTINLGDK